MTKDNYTADRFLPHEGRNADCAPKTAPADCWEDVLGLLGAQLDDSLNAEMPEDIRSWFSGLYEQVEAKVLTGSETKESPAFSQNDLAEFLGQIIDVFEDFLEERGIKLDNPEIDEAICDGQDPDSLAIIYGTDYGNLQDDLESLLRNWGILQEVLP